MYIIYIVLTKWFLWKFKWETWNAQHNLMYLVRCVYTYKCVYGLLDFCLFVVLRIFSGKSFNIFVLFVAFGHSKYIKCIQHKVFSARFSDTFCEHTNYLCIFRFYWILKPLAKLMNKYKCLMLIFCALK